jgi:kinetochore protein NNF1
MPSAVAMPSEEKIDLPVLPSQVPSATLTPGPRAMRFLDLYSKTLSTTLRTVSYENFSACFPTIAAKAPENLKGLHKAMIERLERFAKVGFPFFLIYAEWRGT